MGMAFPQTFVLRNDISTAIKKNDVFLPQFVEMPHLWILFQAYILLTAKQWLFESICNEKMFKDRLYRSRYIIPTSQ